MKIVPLHHREANDFVARWHRHSKPLRVAKLSLGLVDDAGDLRAVAMMMRPATQSLDDGKTIEVARLACDPELDKLLNAPSILYSACARIAAEWGYSRIQTYILMKEPGTSLIAAGWTLEKENCGGVPRATRRGKDVSHEWDAVTMQYKKRWAKVLNPKDQKARKPSWSSADVVVDEKGIRLELHY